MKKSLVKHAHNGIIFLLADSPIVNMKIRGETIEGLKVSEYFLILPLPDSIQGIAADLRSKLHTHCEVNVELKGTPVLAIAHFVQYDSIEERVIKFLNSISYKTEILSLELDGLGSYPHTIFINIKTNQALSKLISYLNTGSRKYMQLNKETKPMIFPKPHITLARKLSPERFSFCWEFMKEEEVRFQFTVHSMTLLKRVPGTKPWSSAREYPFSGNYTEPVQSKLF